MVKLAWRVICWQTTVCVASVSGQHLNRISFPSLHAEASHNNINGVGHELLPGECAIAT